MVTNLTDMTQTTSLADTDLVYAKVDPSGSPADRKITAGDMLRECYGSISVASGAGSQTLVASTWTKVTQFTAQQAGKNCTVSHANDKVTVDNAGRYAVDFWAVFNGTASAAYDWVVYWNGSAIGPYTVTRLDSSDNTETARWSHNNVTVSSGSTDFEVYVRSAGTNDVDVAEGVLSVNRIG